LILRQQQSPLPAACQRRECDYSDDDSGSGSIIFFFYFGLNPIIFFILRLTVTEITVRRLDFRELYFLHPPL
jgi:hypothetical protein